jgi:hypothetical protein
MMEKPTKKATKTHLSTKNTENLLQRSRNGGFSLKKIVSHQIFLSNSFLEDFSLFP